MEYKNKRKLIIGFSLFFLLIVYLFKNLSSTLRTFGFIFGIFIFYILDHMFKIDFKLKHYYYMMIILGGGMLLSPLYFIYPIYDKLLHFIMPIFGCGLVFYAVSKKNLNLTWNLLITFMFIISFLTLHEIGEYILDIFWDMKLQGVYIGDISQIHNLNLVMSQIDDTMMDLILGVGGSLIFILNKIGVHYYKIKNNKN